MAVIATLLLQALGRVLAWQHKSQVGASRTARVETMMLTKGGTMVFGLRERFAGAICARYSLTPAPEYANKGDSAANVAPVVRPDFSETFWKAVDTPLGKTWAGRVFTVGVGWPLVWARATRVEPRVQVVLYVPTIEKSRTPPAGLRQQEHLEIDYVGLVADVAIFWLGWIMIWLGVRRWRWWRASRRWARCSGCGYSRRGLEYGAACPECGRKQGAIDFTSATF